MARFVAAITKIKMTMRHADVCMAGMHANCSTLSLAFWIVRWFHFEVFEIITVHLPCGIPFRNTNSVMCLFTKMCLVSTKQLVVEANDREGQMNLPGVGVP